MQPDWILVLRQVQWGGRLTQIAQGKGSGIGENARSWMILRRFARGLPALGSRLRGIRGWGRSRQRTHAQRGGGVRCGVLDRRALQPPIHDFKSASELRQFRGEQLMSSLQTFQLEAVRVVHG